MTLLQEGARTGKCKLLWGINRPNESDLEGIQCFTQMLGFSETVGTLENAKPASEFQMVFPTLHHTCKCATCYELLWGHSPAGVNAVNW